MKFDHPGHLRNKVLHELRDLTLRRGAELDIKLSPPLAFMVLNALNFTVSNIGRSADAEHLQKVSTAIGKMLAEASPAFAEYDRQTSEFPKLPPEEQHRYLKEWGVSFPRHHNN
jgi:hypothetical protein